MPNVVLAAASGGRGELPAAIRTWTVDPNGAFATPFRSRETSTLRLAWAKTTAR